MAHMLVPFISLWPELLISAELLRNWEAEVHLSWILAFSMLSYCISTSSVLIRSFFQIIEALASIPAPELALRLYLQCAEVFDNLYLNIDTLSMHFNISWILHSKSPGSVFMFLIFLCCLLHLWPLYTSRVPFGYCNKDRKPILCLFSNDLQDDAENFCSKSFVCSFPQFPILQWLRYMSCFGLTRIFFLSLINFLWNFVFQAANDCDLEPVAYEFFTQAYILYEEEISVSWSLKALFI